MILSNDKIKEILDTYATIKTYAGTARECGVSPSTVKRYVERNTPKETIEKKNDGEILHFDGQIKPAAAIDIPPYEARSEWIKLTAAEKKELQGLRREI